MRDAEYRSAARSLTLQRTGWDRRADCGLSSLQQLARFRSETDAANGFQRVAVAIADYTARASEALAMAALAVDPAAGRIRLIHIRPWQLPPPPSREDGSLVPAGIQLFTETAERAATLIDEAIHDIQNRRITVDAIVVEAQQAALGTTLVHVADAWNAELLIIGRRPRRPFSAMLRRRISDQVLREATHPVLIVPSASA